MLKQSYNPRLFKIHDNKEPITVETVNFKYIQDNIDEINSVAETAFFANHELMRKEFEYNQDNIIKTEFKQLFNEHIIDMTNEVAKNSGYFVIAREKDKIVGIAMGLPYGPSALSQDFLIKAKNSNSAFNKTLQPWGDLMMKYFMENPPHQKELFHQVVTAVSPEYLKKGVGATMSEELYKVAKENGYTSSVATISSQSAKNLANKVKKNLKKEIFDISEIECSRDGSLALEFITLVPDSKSALENKEWFESKAKQEQEKISIKI